MLLFWSILVNDISMVSTKPYTELILFCHFTQLLPCNSYHHNFLFTLSIYQFALWTNEQLSLTVTYLVLLTSYSFNF